MGAFASANMASACSTFSAEASVRLLCRIICCLSSASLATIVLDLFGNSGGTLIAA